MSTGLSETGVRGLESRQKLGEMSDFCLPDSPNPGRADLKVDKNRGKCVIFVYRTLQIRGAQCYNPYPHHYRGAFAFSTGLSKSGARSLESRTKSSKIEKIFYSVTFAKNSVVSDYGQILKIVVCP